MVRPIKYTDPLRENLRQRMKKFRLNHANELRAETEHKRLMSLTQNGGDRSRKVFMYETVDELGQTIDVIFSNESEPGEREIRSRFLPSVPIVPKLAATIRDSRLKQIGQWRTGE